MNLAHSETDRRELAVDVFLGALVGLLLSLLGIRDVTSLMSPSTWVLIGAAIGLGLGVVRQRRILLWADGVLCAAVIFIAYTSTMSSVAPRWVRNDTVPDRVDAVVALSGSVRSDSTISSEAFDRLRAAAQIARRDTTAWLVTSRLRESDGGVAVTSDRDQRELVEELGLESRWKVVDAVGSTHDEAIRAAALLLPARRNIVVVTSPIHTRRACATFERVGFHVTCRAAREHRRLTWHPLTPRDRLAAWRDYIYELLGMVKYRAKGWLG
jgi:uncharacterized SAM-binding protein YcdF (DUF218 family)